MTLLNNSCWWHSLWWSLGFIILSKSLHYSQGRFVPLDSDKHRLLRLLRTILDFLVHLQLRIYLSLSLSLYIYIYIYIDTHTQFCDFFSRFLVVLTGFELLINILPFITIVWGRKILKYCKINPYFHFLS
jgi:hypothetical protein